MTAPIITIELDGDSDCFRLLATSHGVTNPCGPRLFRGGEPPQIHFLHTDEEDAIRDCKLLQEYVTLAWSGKAPKAKGREEKEEKELHELDTSGAVWNL